ncbi:MAG: hypothetical protein Q8O67_18100 [Deltaproteobacteria bacterium]|nr:hypothetical protein [Deltaproteobacteria bacterium]
MRFREILVRAHALDAGVLAQAEEVAAQTQAPLVHVLVRYQVLDGRKLARLLSRALHVELIDVGAVDVHPRLLQVIPRYAAERLRVLPIGAKKTADGERLYLAMSDPSDDDTIGVVEKATGRTIEPLVCDDDALSRSFDRHYGVAVVAPVVMDTPVLVGQLSQGAEFLTESTAEALRFVQPARGAPLPQLDPMDHEAPTIEVRMQQRPASLALAAALAEATADNARGGSRSIPTVPEVRGAVSHPNASPVAELSVEAAAPTGVSMAARWVAASKSLEDGDDEALFGEPTREVEAVRSVDLPPPTKVTLALPPGLKPEERASLMNELVELLGPVDVDIDAAAACRSARGARALVLLAPRTASALLRALLDLEEDKDRPKIIVLGGDPALRTLAFVDQHAELPDGPRAIAVAVTVALRQVGVRL